MTTRTRLQKDFYIKEDIVQISKGLLGKVLVTNIDNQLTSGIIVETEAYRAPDDKASHAHNNRFTERTKVMFEEGGCAYVYLCYGIHHMFNVVTAKKGIAHAILVRAIEPVDNIVLMCERRKMQHTDHRLTGGPGKVGKALGITTQLTGYSLVDRTTPIWIEDRGINIDENQIIASPRVRVDYAEECAAWNWRFRIKDSKWTSRDK